MTGRDVFRRLKERKTQKTFGASWKERIDSLNHNTGSTTLRNATVAPLTDGRSNPKVDGKHTVSKQNKHTHSLTDCSRVSKRSAELLRIIAVRVFNQAAALQIKRSIMITLLRIVDKNSHPRSTYYTPPPTVDQYSRTQNLSQQRKQVNT